MELLKPAERTIVPISLLTILPSLLTIVLMAVTSVSSAGSNRADRKSRRNSSVRSGETRTGKATYYPNSLEGHRTSGGETFHQRGHTAASNKLPLGTHIKVTNRANGKSTDVKVNDRGPALGNHKIDLSKQAAKDIGLGHKEGKVGVAIKVTRPPVNSTASSGPP